MEEAVTRMTEKGCIQDKLESESCYSGTIDKELLELDYQPHIIDQTTTTSKYNSQCYKYGLNLVHGNMGEELLRPHVTPKHYFGKISSGNDSTGNTHSHTTNHSIDYELNGFEKLQKWHSTIIRPVAEYIPSSPTLTIYNICTLLALPEIVAMLSLLIYQEFKRRSGVVDRSAIALVVAAIYLVCMRLSLPYNIEEILEKAVVQRLNNKTACMILANNYCKVLLIQNVLDYVISNHAIYSFQVGEENKSWQYNLLHDIEENLLKLRALRNKSSSYILPKPSYILRIHAKGKKQITGELRGKSKEELCAIGVIADYYRKANYFDRKKYMTVPSYKKLQQDPYFLINKMYSYEPIVKMIKHEKGLECSSCNKINRDLSQIIYHLNDDHNMNYQQIADHLEDIGL
jgi:hypothetical protein